jgi:peptide/nickel transport system permease protein
MKFAGYAARRIVYALVVIWVAATAVFILIHLAPGDPVSYVVGRMTTAGQAFANGPAIVARYREQFGLDQPLVNQYVSYLRELGQLNLGYSIPNFPTSVTTLIGRALPYSIGLLATTTVLAFLLGSLLGGFMAWRASAPLSRLVLPLFMLVVAIPPYLVALGSLYLLAYKLHWFPVGGSSGLLNSRLTGVGHLLDIVRHSLLPALSFLISNVGFWMLTMRSAMIPVLGSDYLMLAEAKGLRERRIFLRYAFRNAMLPQVTGLAVSLGHVIAGQVLVEVIFSYPGLGQLLLTAISTRDYPLVQGISLMLVAMVSVGVLIVDLLYPRIDPRITYERR